MPLVSKAFGDIITFTRASTATYFNSAGVLTSAANDVPRLDYDPDTLAARGFLIEEARTNLLLQSADFTTTWSQTNVTITANSTASPDGGTNGDTLLINAAGATTSQTSQSFAAGSTITVSVFAKKNASNFVRFEVGGLVNCWFDLDTGVTGTNSAGSGNVLFSAKSIQAISNGWYHCFLTVTTSTITTLGVNIFATNADGVSSSINSSIFLWGAQLEAGAFPTSYIPTTTTALTRSADVASVNTLSPWYNATEGTIFCQGLTPPGLANFPSIGPALSDGTTNNQIVQYVFTNGYYSGTRVGGVAQGNTAILTTPTIGAQYKFATAYANNDSQSALNGTASTVDNTYTVPTVNQMRINTNGTVSSNLPNSWVQRITYYPRRLSDAELQAITA